MKYILEITEDGYWFITTYFKTGYLSFMVYRHDIRPDVLGHKFKDVEGSELLILHEANKERLFYEDIPLTKTYLTNIK